MTWFKVDDSFYRHGKVRRLGPKHSTERAAAAGIWTFCGTWSADNLTDGFVPWEVVDEWDIHRESTKRLISAGLWIEAEDGGEAGVRFCDWGQWQPTRDQVFQRRKADAERRARWRESRKESRRDNERDEMRDETRESPNASRPGSVLPDPTRPVPSTSSGQVKEGGVTQVTREDQKTAPPKDHQNPQKRPRCADHRHIPDGVQGPPCTACRDARLAQTGDPDLAKRLRRKAIKECPACDEYGWELDDVGAPAEPAKKCNHL